MTTTKHIDAIIIEQGNGFPFAGDIVCIYGDAYRVVSVDSDIQTIGRSANWVYATIVACEWPECDSELFMARVVIEGSEDDDDEGEVWL